MVTGLQAIYLGFIGLERKQLAALTLAIGQFGSLDQLRGASDADLLAARLDPGAIRRLLKVSRSTTHRELIRNTNSWLKQSSTHHLVCLEDATYPPLLREIHAPPALLFVKGKPEVLTRPHLAIVGSRKATQIGLETAFWLGTEIARLGVSVCSGMAKGIDTSAHQGALATECATTAVVGTGPDRVYPPTNRKLAEAIARQGAVISEFPVSSPPRPEHFPRRNRIISGMSLGTIVVEATRNSGSLITAQLAMEQNREVFAVPGTIRDGRNQGCHWLIKQGAKLVETVTDIVEEIQGIGIPAGMAITGKNTLEDISKKRDGQTDRLTGEESKILSGLDESEVPLDTLAVRLSLPPEHIDRMLCRLELRGIVERQAGRIRRVSRCLHNPTD